MYCICEIVYGRYSIDNILADSLLCLRTLQQNNRLKPGCLNMEGMVEIVKRETGCVNRQRKASCGEENLIHDVE